MAPTIGSPHRRRSAKLDNEPDRPEPSARAIQYKIRVVKEEVLVSALAEELKADIFSELHGAAKVLQTLSQDALVVDLPRLLSCLLVNVEALRKLLGRKAVHEVSCWGFVLCEFIHGYAVLDLTALNTHRDQIVIITRQLRDMAKQKAAQSSVRTLRSQATGLLAAVFRTGKAFAEENSGKETNALVLSTLEEHSPRNLKSEMLQKATVRENITSLVVAWMLMCWLVAAVGYLSV